MNKTQAIADLTMALSRATTPDEATTLVRRALRMTGLTYASTITEEDMTSVLSALAAEGGPIQELAEWIAVNGLDDGPRAA